MTSSANDVRLAYYELPRDGSYAALSIASVLQAMGVQRQGKGAQTYVNHQFIKWERALSRFQIFGLERSMPYESLDYDGEEGQSHRVLLDKSVSSHGALLLLARWAFLPKRSGGMEQPCDRYAASGILQRMLQH